MKKQSDDALTRLYDIQKVFMMARGIRFTPDWLTREKRVDLAKEYLLRLFVELGEIFNEGGFKYPERDLEETQVPMFQKELIDSFMYLMQLFILFEIPPAEIEKLYREKLAVVQERAKSWVKPKILYCVGRLE